MNPEPVIISDPLRVEARLRELGVTLAILLGALEAGIAAAAFVTINHPPNFGGTTIWAQAVRYLRDTLMDLGWTRDNSYNFPTVVRGDGLVALAVARGDDGTGDETKHPSTQYARGIVMARAVAMNTFLPFEHLPPNHANTALQTWLLMHNRQGNQLLCELSCPTAINQAGFVEAWGERIILTPLALDPARMPVLETQPFDPDVDVRRRA